MTNEALLGVRLPPKWRRGGLADRESQRVCFWELVAKPSRAKSKPSIGSGTGTYQCAAGEAFVNVNDIAPRKHVP